MRTDKRRWAMPNGKISQVERGRTIADALRRRDQEMLNAQGFDCMRSARREKSRRAIRARR